jgi:hypothetical protein
MAVKKDGQMYRVTAGPGVDLTGHVGHRVQLTGTATAMAGSSSSMTQTETTTKEPATGNTTTTASTVKAGDFASSPELIVTAVKHVAADCK